MKVTVAKNAGFCFGVERAVNRAYEEASKSDKPIYTYGPIIHNEQVVEDLEQKGIKVVNSLEELSKKEIGTVIIRSHGVSKDVYTKIEEIGMNIVDVTCPFVKKIHKIVEEESSNCKIIVIVGNDIHPEVEGIKGWVNGKSYVVNSEEDINKLNIPLDKEICIVSQTTFNYNKFQYLVEIIEKKGYYINVVNTICNATHLRQVEAKKVSSSVDAMIVIGGKHSSNTQKLYEICKNECKNTYYIQTVEDLDLCELKTIESIGITAGASTPNNIIEEVHTICQK